MNFELHCYMYMFFARTNAMLELPTFTPSV